jgi:ketosteroid isomerase-like protein
MKRGELILMVEQYFAAVDNQDFEALKAVLDVDCVFTVETHGVELDGIEAIEGMFLKLWADHKAVQHKNFKHLPDETEGCIASQFTVVNTEHDGSLTYKSNCNFFEVGGMQFSKVAVYMAGANTLHE